MAGSLHILRCVTRWLCTRYLTYTPDFQPRRLAATRTVPYTQEWTVLLSKTMAAETEDSKAWAFHMMRRLGIDPASTIGNNSHGDATSDYRECAMAATALHSSERPLSSQSSEKTSYCNVCNLQFCDNCWNVQPTHVFGTLGVTGVPHEKTDPDVAEIVRATLEVTTSDDQQQELHAEDEDTTWFGMVEVNGEPTFRDYGRFSDLMASFPMLHEERCCPGLVSFVGPTGICFAPVSSLRRVIL